MILDWQIFADGDCAKGTSLHNGLKVEATIFKNTDGAKIKRVLGRNTWRYYIDIEKKTGDITRHWDTKMPTFQVWYDDKRHEAIMFNTIGTSLDQAQNIVEEAVDFLLSEDNK